MATTFVDMEAASGPKGCHYLVRAYQRNGILPKKRTSREQQKIGTTALSWNPPVGWSCASHTRSVSMKRCRIGGLYGTCGPVPLITPAQQLVDIRERVAASRLEAAQLRLRETRCFVESRLRDLRALFSAEAVTVRAETAKHVQRITLTLEGRTYIAYGAWDLLAWQHGSCRGPDVLDTATSSVLC